MLYVDCDQQTKFIELYMKKCFTLEVILSHMDFISAKWEKVPHMDTGGRLPGFAGIIVLSLICV
jgi:hypothetical protein